MGFGLLLFVLAQANVTPLPEKHIPGTVLLELRAVENGFDLQLSRDCAPERCVSKGCVYRDHAAVDLPRQGSLPGLGPGENQGVGSVPPQEYLTQAHCEFAHEKSVPLKDVQALQKRLEMRLSKGWLRVTVGRQLLEPINPALANSPPPPPEPVKPEPKPEPAPPPKEPEPPQKWEAEIALRELWVTLLPHFAWMIAAVMATVAALTLIWATRRVGKESLEEKMLAAQLTAGAVADKEKLALQEVKDGEKPGELPGDDAKALPVGEDAAFVSEQQKVWTERIGQSELATDEGGIAELLRSWLAHREYELLAKAVMVFGDKLALAFSSDVELAQRKVEFADYLRGLDEKALPSDAEFFKKLNQHAIASSLLAQADAETYRSIREEFGSTGIAHLVERLPARNGALLFALVPGDAQQEVARSLSPARRLEVAEQLLTSNRINRQDREHLFATLDAARSGKPLQKPPLPGADSIADRGREFDAAGALSVLLQFIAPTARKALFDEALDRAGGSFPAWYDNILFPDMLMKLPAEVRTDMLLGVEIKALAGWASMQQAQWQQSFFGSLAPSMQAALRANGAFATKAEQLRQAQAGRIALVEEMKRLMARGTASLSGLVA